MNPSIRLHVAVCLASLALVVAACGSSGSTAGQGGAPARPGVNPLAPADRARSTAASVNADVEAQQQQMDDLAQPDE